MKKSIDISVVGIAHDGYGKYIPKWLDSVCDQEVKPKEAIVILSENHGLTTELPENLNGVNVRVIHEPRYSRGVLRNKAMDKVNTQWVLFFDTDDVLLPNAIKEIDKKRDADVVALNYYKEYKGNRERMETPIPEVDKLPQWRKYYCNASGYVAFRLSLGIKHEDLDTPDYPFYFKALSVGAEFKSTDKPCAIYKKKDTGHAKSKTPEQEAKDFKMIKDSAMYYYNLIKND